VESRTVGVDAVSAGSKGRPRRPRLALAAAVRQVTRHDEIGVLGALIVILIIFSLLSAPFRTFSNLMLIVRQITLLGIMAVGMTFVMSAGDIDLSVGSTLNITIISMASVLAAGQPWWVAVPIGLALGTLCGFINGGLSVLLGIPCIIITLATLSLYKGVSLLICDGRAVTSFPKDNVALFTFGSAKIGHVPAIVFGLLIVVLVGYVVFSRTVFGRHVCATGSNRKAAIYSGINVGRMRILVMTLSGFLSSIAATLALAHLKNADPGSGAGYELDVIAGVIIGGTRFSGGKGTVIGSIIGVAIMGTLRNGLIMLAVSPYWQMVLTGAVIVTAVALDYLLGRR
jgi:ribose transport system permease protein